MKRRTLTRIGVVLLVAGLVAAVTWARVSPYDWTRDLAAQEAAAKDQRPAPGAEAALRRLVAAPPRRPPRPGTDVTHLGPMQSVSYLGSFLNPPLLGGRIDNFLVRYRNGALFWRVGLGKDGKANTVIYFNPEPMTPQQTRALFAPAFARPWWFPMAIQLVALLVFALVGRLVLRIRL